MGILSKVNIYSVNVYAANQHLVSDRRRPAAPAAQVCRYTLKIKQ
jgi:hypothetical protein